MAHEIKTIEEARRYVDYADWFTDVFAKQYLSGFPSRYKDADAAKKEEIMKEARMAVFNYALIIYKIYPSSAELRRKIQSDAVLAGNFEAMKKWLEARGVDKHLDEMTREMEAK